MKAITYRYAIMALTLFLISCTNKKDKINYQLTSEICEGIYVEKYMLNRGEFGEEFRSNYLTDSINFELFIDAFDDDEFYQYICDDYSILIIHYCKRFIKPVPCDTTIYSIEELKSMNNYPK